MAEITNVNIGGTQYDLCDTTAREATADSVHYRGKTGSASMETLEAAFGDVYRVGDSLYMWDGNEWLPFSTGAPEIGTLVYRGSTSGSSLAAMTGMQDGDVWHCGSDNTVNVYLNGAWHYLDRVAQTVDEGKNAVSGKAVMAYTKTMMRFRGAMTYDEMCRLGSPRLGDTCYVTDAGVFYTYRADGYWERVSPPVTDKVRESDTNPVSSAAVHSELQSIEKRLQYKGNAVYNDLLEMTDAQKGDMYAVADDDTLAIFNGDSWFYLRPPIGAPLEGGGLLPVNAQGVIDHVAEQLTSVWKYKGSASIAMLAAMTDMQDGDVWYCTSDELMYVYLVDKWRALDRVEQTVGESKNAVSGAAVMTYVAEQTAALTRYKGAVSTNQLQSITDQQIGDLYYNGSTNYAVIWDGEQWASLGRSASGSVTMTDNNAVSGAAVYSFVESRINALMNGNEVAY